MSPDVRKSGPLFFEGVSPNSSSRVKGADSVDTLSRGEMVEKELDALITRRDDKRRQTEGERLEEELYEPSVRMWRERREAARRAEWCEYHQDQAARHRATLEALAAYHESEAARLMEPEPKGETA